MTTITVDGHTYQVQGPSAEITMTLIKSIESLEREELERIARECYLSLKPTEVGFDAYRGATCLTSGFPLEKLRTWLYGYHTCFVAPPLHGPDWS